VASTLFAPAGTCAATKPFAGKTLNVFMFDHPYPRALKQLLPQFTDRTGIKVEIDTPSFVVYNQRADLELSTGSGAFDVMTMTFIFSGKWIGAGWAAKLNDFIAADPALNPADFLAGAMAPMKAGNDILALPFVAESTLMVYRTDLLKRAGVRPPETFDELLAVAPKLQTAETEGVHGPRSGRRPLDLAELPLRLRWAVLCRPPKDMTPLLASPESIKAAGCTAQALRDYSVPGVASYAEPQSSGGMMEGRPRSTSTPWPGPGSPGDPAKSKVYDKVAYTLPPGGPAGRFPQVAVHGMQIPAGAKQKEVSWEFIRWALSKEVMSHIAETTTYPAVTRASVLDSPKYKQKYNWGGSDIGALHGQVLKLAGSGYMAYRTVPEFPPIGDRVTIGVTEVMTGQKPADQAMRDTSRDIEAILTRRDRSAVGTGGETGTAHRFF
jgi:multiple sugar transport system substrate-binding protein